MSTKPQLSDRLEFVDGTRGLAVLFMLVLHTAHGWVQQEDRFGGFWYWVTSVGGLAAPLFFLLLGVGFGLRGDGARDAAGVRRETARGLGLLVLGYLLRVQMWQFDGAAVVDPPQLAAGLVLAAGYLTLWHGLRRWGDGGRAAGALAAGVVLAAAGLWGASRVAGPHFANLLRFDVLQGLGLTAALLSPLSGLSRNAKRGGAAALALFVLASTPWFRGWVPGPLPPYLAAPLASWSEPGRSPWAMFPLFPWAAYACVGVLVGSYLQARRASRQPLGRALLALGALGVALLWLTSEDLDRVTSALDSYPALVQPCRVLYRLGAGFALLAVVYGWAAAGRLRRNHGLPSSLVALGRASLWVYWVHLEFAFGAPATPLRRQLGPGAWAAGLVALAIAMLGVARFVGWWRKQPATRAAGGGGHLAGNLNQGA